MPAVHVCPLSQVAPTVAACGASHLVTLINLDTPVARPDTILAENHLFVGINDIIEPTDGLVLASDDHVRTLIAFFAQLGPVAAAGHPLLRRHQPLDRRRLHRAVRGAARPRRARPSRRRCATPRRSPRRTGGWSPSPTACSAATAAWSRPSTRSAAARWPWRTCRSCWRWRTDWQARRDRRRSRSDCMRQSWRWPSSNR